jgi:phage/plasmid-associated DNA primase
MIVVDEEVLFSKWCKQHRMDLVSLGYGDLDKHLDVDFEDVQRGLTAVSPGLAKKYEAQFKAMKESGLSISEFYQTVFDEYIGMKMMDAGSNKAPPPLEYSHSKKIGDADLPEPAMDILQGKYQVEKLNPLTGMNEYHYYQWLARALASQGVNPHDPDVIDALSKYQAMFNAPAYHGYVNKTQYLDIPPKTTYTAKLFPNFSPAKKERVSKSVGSPEWDAMKDRLLLMPYLFIEADKTGKGYWAKCVDKIGSWYTSNVVKELEAIVREVLATIHKFQTKDVREMIQQLAEARHVSIDVFHQYNRDLIHFKNGVYRISTREFVSRDGTLPGTWKDNVFTTRPLNVNYRPELDLDVPLEVTSWGDLLGERLFLIEFERTIHRLLDCPPDPEDPDNKGHPGQYERFWQWLGYCLTDRIDLNKSAIFSGEPDTGKTSTLETIFNYWQSPDGDATLIAYVDFIDVCNPKDLDFSGYVHGKKVMFDDEMGNEPITTYSKFKKRVSASTQRVREMYVGSYSGDATAKFSGCVNYLPIVENIGISFGKRIMPFFCQRPYSADEKDEWLVLAMRESRLLGEYIMAKAIKYLHLLLESGWVMPEEITPERVVHWWLLESDVIYSFINQCCDRVDSVEESTIKAEAWFAFTKYRDAVSLTHGGEYITSQGEFTKKLGGYQPPFPVRNGGERETTEWNKKTSRRDNVTKRVDVYFGLHVNEEKLAKFVDDAPVLSPTKNKRLSHVEKDTLEQQIMAVAAQKFLDRGVDFKPKIVTPPQQGVTTVVDDVTPASDVVTDLDTDSNKDWIMEKLAGKSTMARSEMLRITHQIFRCTDDAVNNLLQIMANEGMFVLTPTAIIMDEHVPRP